MKTLSKSIASPKFTRVLLVAASCALVPIARAEDISVAVAANFTDPMKKISAAFEKSSGHKLVMSYGATGAFYTQIKQGAPFQVFLAADDETPARLEKEGNGVPGTRDTYAFGKLVLWSSKPAIVDSQGVVLKGGGFDHIALANPKLAPYGAAAVEAMKALGADQSLTPKFVMGQNIAQTFQFVESGNALLGFVAYSQVVGDNGKLKRGSMWVIPEKLYSPIRQDVVLLDKGKDSKAARQLLAFLKGKEAVKFIEDYGYTLPK